MELGGKFDPATVEYVATMEDLTNTFPKLPPPEKVKDDVLKCLVRVRVQVHREAGHMIIIPPREETIAHLCFRKMMDNGKLIWIYEGKVKL